MEPAVFERPPTIDGLVNEDEWRAAAPLPLVNLYPSFEAPLTERTEIRIGSDSSYFYASIRAWDTEPDRIRATTLYRDRWQTDEEFVVILDTFADGQNAAMFLVTPAGVRVDNQLTNDAEPGRGEWMNRDWNVPWDAAAVRLPDGWSAEMRVPFSSLRFTVVDGLTQMKVKSYRYLPRKGENQIYPATRPDAGTSPHFKPSLGQPMAFRNLRPATPVYVQPYIAATTAARGQDAGAFDIGVDVKLSPTRSTTLDLTVNTDFAQVEVDSLQLNLTRIPLFFPERRPFFLERAGLFSVGRGSNDTLFHSRRVGLGDDGAPRPIRGGARLVGRAGGWDVGILNVQTGSPDPGGAGNNAGVVRLQRLSSSGHAIGFTTTTLAGNGSNSLAGAVDASFAVGRQRLSTVWATSSGAGTPLERSRGSVRWQRGAQQGLAFIGEYRFTGEAFRPTLGFVRVTDSHEVEIRLRQSWRPPASTRVRSHGWTMDNSARWRRGDATLEEARTSVGWAAETIGGVFGRAALIAAEEDVPVAFSIAGVRTVAPGRYRTAAGQLLLSTPSTSAFQLTAEGTAGGFYGGRRFNWRLSPTWKPSAHFGAWAIVDRTRLSGLAQPSRSITLTSVGVNAALNTQLFLDLLAQRAPGRPAIGQARFRWNPSEGHDLWAVLERGETATGTTRYSFTMKYAKLLSR
jgi:hypothetical protein